MLSNRRLALLLLGLAGVLVVHQFAHGLTRLLGLGSAEVGHGHMAFLWATLGPLGAIAVAMLAVRQTRAFHLADGLPLVTLATLIAGGYVGLEMIEHLSSSLTAFDALTAPSVLLGIALAPFVAQLLGRAVRGAAAVIEALTEIASLRRSGPPIVLRITERGDVVPEVPAQFSQYRRGPPQPPHSHHS